jgi:hypothetical protein
MTDRIDPVMTESQESPPSGDKPPLPVRKPGATNPPSPRPALVLVPGGVRR